MQTNKAKSSSLSRILVSCSVSPSDSSDHLLSEASKDFQRAAVVLTQNVIHAALELDLAPHQRFRGSFEMLNP